MWRVPLGTRHGTSLPGTSHLRSLYLHAKADIYFIIIFIFPASPASNISLVVYCRTNNVIDRRIFNIYSTIIIIIIKIMNSKR